MSSLFISNLWLIPAVPFGLSVLILSLQESGRKSGATLAVISQIAALALSIFAFAATLQQPGFRAARNFIWFTFGDQALRLGFVLDPLGAAMLVMIALVGLASYLLIGFWIERPSAAAAAKKAFITTRIGDLGLFLGMLWLYHRSGTLLFYDDGRGCLESAALVTLGGSATFIALLIFVGAMGKSGQFPLHVWLPDAMEGPTPVSALIHAATMVAAGVFLVARVYPIFSVGAINVGTVIAWIG